MIRQGADCRQDSVSHLSALGGLGRAYVGRLRTGSSVERDRSERSAPRQAITVLEDDPPQPAREGCRQTERAQVAIRLDERLLRGILRQMKIAQDGVRVAEGHVLETSHDLAVGVQVALLRVLNQCSQLVHASGPSPPEGVL